MRVWIVVVMLALGACAKKQQEAPAAEQKEPAAEPAPATKAPASEGGVGGATGGGEADPLVRMPSDDGGEVKKPMPADDGGEAAKRACTKTADCAANHDCCNGHCYKHGTAKHAIECKLPDGKL